MVSRELETVITHRYGTGPDTTDYLDQLKHLRDSAV